MSMSIKSEIDIKDEPLESYDAYLANENILNYDSVMHQGQVYSASSAIDIKSEREDPYQYLVGDVVWVNVRGNPLWPGMITYPKNESQFMKFKVGSSNKAIDPMQYHVRFFNDNQRTMWVSSTFIFLYNGLENLSLYFDKIKSGKTCKASERNLLKAFSKMGSLLTRKATNSKSLRWYQAIREADEAMDVKRCEGTPELQEKETKKIKLNEDLENSLDPIFAPSSLRALELPSEPLITDYKWETLSNMSDSSSEFSSFEEEKVESEKNSQHGESFKDTQEASAHASLSSSPLEQQKSFFKTSDKALLPCSDFNYKNPKDKLKLHVLDHSSSKLFKCFMCNFGTNHRKVLKSHLLIHSDTKLFKCSECSYITNCISDLRGHLLNHEGTKLFKCSECDYKTNRKANLKFHLVIHSDTKLFKCSKCEYETNRKDCLRSHLLKHSDTKLFKCFECDFETKREGALKIHLLIHSGTKRFKCSECSYATNWKRDLKVHLNKHHSDTKLFKCSKCDYETNYKRYLKSHLLNHNDK